MAALSVHMARLGRKPWTPVRGAGVEEPLPQLGVGRHAAAEAHPLGADGGGGPPGLGDEDVDHRLLERRRTRRRCDTSGCLRTWLTTAVFRPLKEKS